MDQWYKPTDTNGSGIVCQNLTDWPKTTPWDVPDNLNMGLVRWAMMGKASGFTSTMIPQHKDGTFCDTSPPRKHKFGQLTGAVSYFGWIYVIKFIPVANFVMWRMANENDIGTFGITVTAWNEHERTKSRNQPIVPPGFIQDEFVARVLEHVTHISPWWQRKDIQLFFKKHQWMKRKNLKKIVIPGFTNNTKKDLRFFIAIVAIIDPSLSWKKDGDSAYCEFDLKGRPYFFINNSLTYSNCVSHATSEWKANDAEYGTPARAVLWRMQKMTDEHNAMIVALMHR